MPIVLFFLCLLLGNEAMASDFGISVDDFRTQYNLTAKLIKAPLMPEEISESLAVPEEADSARVLSTVSIYFLNDRVSLLINCLNNSPDLVSGAAIMANSNDEYTLKDVSDVQTSMITLISVLTPSIQERKELLIDLGIVSSENGDFTDGKVRSKITKDHIYYTVSKETTGIELVIRPVNSPSLKGGA